jgi:hypothetical protein
MRILIAAALLSISTLNAQIASIKIFPVHPAGSHSALSSSVSFFCTTDYDPKQCLAGATALANVLEKYPTVRLGQWGFILEDSRHWKQTLKALGANHEAPAFTELGARVTVLENTLFEDSNSQKILISQRFGLPVEAFLDYAVTHELGHAICHERNEKYADEYGLELRMGRSPICGSAR